MEILDTPESLEIKVPIRKYWIPMFLCGASAIVFSISVILFFLLLAKKIIVGDSLGIPIELYAHILLCPIFLNLAMWFNFGYEKIIFTNDRLELIKSNRIFYRKKKFNVSEINSVEIRKDNPNILERVQYIREMRRAVFFWRKMGRIILKTNKSKLTILNGLPRGEVVQMKQLIEKEIEQRRP
ncbi:MAG: hypothetical protein AB8F94_08220 [Saprospiraceae bacterium]